MRLFKIAVIIFVIVLTGAVLNKNKVAVRKWIQKESRAATMIIFKQHLINMEEKFGQNGAVQT